MRACAKAEHAAQAMAQPSRRRRGHLGAAVKSLSFMVLMAAGWVRLQQAHTVPAEHLASIRGATVYEPIFNGEGHGEAGQRFHGRENARGEVQPWATELEGIFEDILEREGLLASADGRPKVVNDCYALRSEPCLPDVPPPHNLGDVYIYGAAERGRQPTHSDAPNPSRGRIGDLANADVPLSIMLAIEPNTKLWIYPNGCDDTTGALLVELNVGDALVWRGDLVHAGCGYAVQHYRLHAYIDPPRDIYRRPIGTDKCVAQPLFEAEGEREGEAGAGAEAEAEAESEVAKQAAAAGELQRRAIGAKDRREATAAAKQASAASAVRKAAAAAAAKGQQMLDAALQRRHVLTPRSPTLSGGAASAHSSPSLHPDELSDAYDSEDEAAFNVANPLGLADEHADDDGEEALNNRLDAAEVEDAEDATDDAAEDANAEADVEGIDSSPLKCMQPTLALPPATYC